MVCLKNKTWFVIQVLFVLLMIINALYRFVSIYNHSYDYLVMSIIDILYLIIVMIFQNKSTRFSILLLFTILVCKIIFISLININIPNQNITVILFTIALAGHIYLYLKRA
ncbi:hypothetical protein DV872_21850 [Oceanispirochaeta sp. M1]|nr:hypothetical protein DV872_21850 [Oceanispirochaeta sp. M1]